MKKIIIVILFSLLYSKGNAQCWESANNSGSNLSAGIKSDGTLWAWGRDTPSQGVNSNLPIQIGSDTDWKTVSSAWNFRIALKDNGTLWYWGFYPTSQTTSGTTISTYVSLPTQLGTDTDWKFVDCSGGAHCLAIKQDGSLWGWGGSWYGQLGLGSFYTNTILVPTRIGTDNDWEKAVVSYIFNNGYSNASSFAIKTNGTLWAWGSNESGQLGDGTSISKNVPVQIGSSTDWSLIYSAWNTTLAIKTDGTLWAAGSNYLGRYGNGTQTSSPTFIQIGTDTNWKSVAVGWNHSLGVKMDGTLWAWGDNHYSGFGTGNDIDSLVPIRVGAESDWQSVSIGKGTISNSQALKSDATLWAWGGYSASLGIGTIPGGVRSYPAQVSCNSLGNEIFSNDAFSIYPNPASEIINIQNPQQLTVTKMSVYDISGKKIVEINDNATQINISPFEKGMYLIQIFAADGIHQQKFIKL
jgi:alpha-tubulin suppressor-like RCC1 family protein